MSRLDARRAIVQDSAYDDLSSVPHQCLVISLPMPCPSCGDNSTFPQERRATNPRRDKPKCSNNACDSPTKTPPAVSALV